MSPQVFLNSLKGTISANAEAAIFCSNKRVNVYPGTALPLSLLTQISLGRNGYFHKQQASHKDFAGGSGLCKILVSLKNH